MQRVLRLFLLAASGFLPAVAQADLAQDLALIHREVAGGAARARLQAVRLEGRTLVGGAEARFTLWQQRPNRVRLETRVGDRVLVQAYDGVMPPWGLDPAQGGAPALLSPREAREFAGEADFDGPLIDHRAKGYALAHAGEVEVAGRPCHHLILAGRDAEVVHLYLDAETFLVRRRQSARPETAGAADVAVDYDDYRMVGGVALPFRITARRGGVVLSETLIESAEPNPAIPSGWFDMPVRP